MKTLVEIYDDQQIMNLLTGYAEQPQNTVFLYEKRQSHLIHNPIVEKYGGNVRYVCVDVFDIEEVLNTLDTEDLAFDIEGGSEILLAMIIRFADAHGCPMYFSDMIDGNVLILRGKEKITREIQWPKLTVREMIRLYGGEVRNLPEVMFDEKGRQAVEDIMKVKRLSNRAWTNFCKTMGSYSRKFPDTDTWTLEASVFNEYRTIFQGIQKSVFSEFLKFDKVFTFTFASGDYKILVTDAGVAFEYDTFYQLQDAGIFDDLDLRVNIDWNGGSFERNDPNSELDVLATKNGRLISISCKAGKYDQQAIYEVKANAVRFGGERALPVLCNDNDEDHYELVRKAEELGVLLIEHRDMWERRAAERIAEWLED